jgi:hypothetical protein
MPPAITHPAMISVAVRPNGGVMRSAVFSGVFKGAGAGAGVCLAVAVAARTGFFEGISAPLYWRLI